VEASKRRFFQAGDMQKLIGKIVRLGEGAPWIFKLMSHIYTSLAFALQNNKTLLEASSHKFRSLISQIQWSNNIAICLIPILAPIFFGQESIEGSVFDDDFVDKMKAISEKHGKWADLMVEFYNQQEESTSDLDKIIDRPKNPRRSNLKLLLPQVSKLSISLSPPTPASINSPTL
jgi:hypothetical protein